MITSFDNMFFPDKMPVNGLSNDNTRINPAPVWPESPEYASLIKINAVDRLAQSYALIEALFDSIAMMDDDDADMALDRLKLEIDEEQSARNF